MTELLALAALAATLAAGPDEPTTHGTHLRARLPFANSSLIDNGPLATPRPYPESIVDDTRRPGFNGRVWVSRTHTHQPTEWALDWPEPGPAEYGAPETLAPTVYARVGTQAIGLSPWSRLEGDGLSHLEEARVYWLRQQNYTGGVRTHVHPATLQQLMHGGPRVAPMEQMAPMTPITPAATIQLRPEAPRTSGPQRRVDADAVRVSLPDRPLGVVRVVASN